MSATGFQRRRREAELKKKSEAVKVEETQEKKTKKGTAK